MVYVVGFVVEYLFYVVVVVGVLCVVGVDVVLVVEVGFEFEGLFGC